MQIVESFSLTAFRKLISELLDFPLDRVLQYGLQQDVSKLSSFITVQKTPSSELSTHKRFRKLDEYQNIESQKETTLIVSFHGKNSVFMAEYFQCALISEKANALFDRIKAGLVRSSDIRDLTIPIGGGYEERAQIELLLSHNFIIEHEQNRIDTVEIGLVVNQ